MKNPNVETIPTFDGIFLSLLTPLCNVQCIVHGLVNSNKKNGFSQTSPWFDWDQNPNFNRFFSFDGSRIYELKLQTLRA